MMLFIMLLFGMSAQGGPAVHSVFYYSVPAEFHFLVSMKKALVFRQGLSSNGSLAVC